MCQDQRYSRAGPPVGVSGGDAAFPQSLQHRRRIDTHLLPDPRQRPALPAEPDSLVDLVGSEAASPHRHVVPMQGPTHRPPVNPELFAELVDRRASLVPRDEFLDLLALKLSG